MYTLILYEFVKHCIPRPRLQRHISFKCNKSQGCLLVPKRSVL